MTSITGGGLTQQLYQRLFDHLDVDKSAALSVDELKAAGSDNQDYASAFKMLDADSDGKISRAEMTGSSAPFSNDTLSALVETQTAQPSQNIHAANKATLGLLEGTRSEQETQDVAALFARADTDGDGKLSDSEWDAEKALRRASNLDSGTISGPIFINVDANGDGLTSTDEVRAGRAVPLNLVATIRDDLPTEAPPSPTATQTDTGSSDTIGATTASSAEDKQKILEQAKADWAERTSGGAGTYKFLDREIAAYRSAAQADLSSTPLSDALSTRLMNQILASLETKTADLTNTTSA